MIHYLPLVYKIAWGFAQKCDEPIEDLIQVGSIGLIKAFGKFDRNKRNSPAGLIRSCVKGEISHYLRDRVTTIRTPRGNPPKRISSLDIPVSESKGDIVSLGDTIADTKNPSQYLDLQLAIAKLEPELRYVVEQIYLCDRITKELALELGCSPAAVYRKRDRALNQLKRILKEE